MEDKNDKKIVLSECDYIKRGDCLNLLKELDDDSVDVVFTSPPYNRIRNDKYDFYNDTLSDYLGMLVKFTDESLRIARDKVIVNLQQNHFNKRDVFRYFGRYANNIAGIVIWTKTNPQPSRNYHESDNTRSITNAYEYFVVLNKSGEQFRCYGDENTLNYIMTSINSDHNNQHHAVMKKEVCDWFIKKFTKEGDIILDPFLGTATTAICAIENDRHYIGFEISEEYYNICMDRIAEAKKIKIAS